MYDDLKGGEADPDDGPLFSREREVAAADTGEETLVDQRIHAWAQLAITATLDSGVYVTTGKTVLDALIELGIVADQPLYAIDNVPIDGVDTDTRAWQQALLDRLDRYTAAEKPADKLELPEHPDAPAGRGASLTVYAAKNMGPIDFFSRLGAQSQPSEDLTEKGSYHHTVICLIG